MQTIVIEDGPSSFAETFCSKHGCRRDEFESVIFQETCPLPPPLNRFASVYCRWFPSFLEIDQLAIERIGRVVSRHQFRAEVDDLYYVQCRDRGFWERILPFGISVKKLTRLETLLEE